MADNKFLDQQGLGLVWEQIKLKYASKVDLTEVESALQESIDTKANAAALSEAVEQLTTAIDNVESKMEGDYTTKEETNEVVEAAIARLIDSAPEDLDTLREIAEELKTEAGIVVNIQKEVDDNKAAIEELQQESVPMLSEDGKYFFANGQAISIAAGAEENSVDVTYFSGTKYATINVPDANRVTFFGAGDGRVKNVEYPGTSITVRSGNIRNIVGGGLDNCTVGAASIIVNGGKVMSVLGGGFGDNLSPANGAGNVAAANIVINGGDITMVYGGGQNITNVGNTKVDIYDGNIGYLTTGGSNGSTGSGVVTVYGGTVDVWQAVNRGTLENSVQILDGGTINKMYCVGETEDATVTGNVSYTTVKILHGSINRLRKGDGYATYGVLKGEYRQDIVAVDVDNILKDFNKISDAELEALTAEEILDICK